MRAEPLAVARSDFVRCTVLGSATLSEVGSAELAALNGARRMAMVNNADANVRPVFEVLKTLLCIYHKLVFIADSLCCYAVAKFQIQVS